MEIKATARKLRFGHCTLDEGRGVLVAPDGTETLLRPKTFELLRLLLRHAGRVVAREEILDAVWPGIFVTDDSITQCVVELRRAMGEGGAGLLRTVPRRGYLLQAEVIAEAPPPSPLAEPMLSARADDRPSIAVLPFRKDHPDPEEAYFADGIIEGIVHVLSGLDGVFVVSRGSALAFAQMTTDARAAGRELGVRYVLYGGVRRAGGRLRITTELTDAERGTILRTDRYEGDTADLFALQDRIAEQVAAAIAPHLREQELMRALRKPPATLGAYDLVLRALDQLRRLDEEAFAASRATLDQAIAADPGYGAAHSYLAWWHMLRIGQGWSRDAVADHDAAERHAEMALERDRQDALAITIRGSVLGYVRRDFEAARRLLDRAVELSPSCALAWAYGAGLRCWVGEGEAALRHAERAVRLAPLDPFSFLHEHMLAQAHYTLGRLDQAIAWAQRSAIANPRHAPNWRLLVASLAGAGRAADAAEPAARLLRLDPGFTLGAFAARTPLAGELRETFVGRLRLAGLPD
jgi:TolB-like protein